MEKLIFKIEKTYFRIFNRFTPLKSHIFGYPITVADKSSFASMYEEIFIRQIYKNKINRPNPLIIDCGSNIGLSIIYFKKKYPESRIIGFEPDPAIFKILKDNITNSKSANVTLINKALSNKEGVVNFFLEGADGGRIAHKDDNKIISVETTSLRPFLNEKVDLLKIDIEGSETLVIKDCQDLLKNIDKIFIEYHSVLNSRQTLDEILTILTNNNFRYYIENTGIKSNNPFEFINSNLNYDLQINIFANKNE